MEENIRFFKRLAQQIRAAGIASELSDRYLEVLRHRRVLRKGD